MKIVINTCYGGFGLSDAAKEYFENLTSSEVNDWEIARNDPHLVHVVEELGEDSWGYLAKLNVVEIPDDIEWEIEYYDGKEYVREVSRSWS
jgi:hypothetical protein